MKKILYGLLATLLVGFLLLPQNMVIPVKGATKSSWNPKTFWHDGWGKSGVHKGIDIFAAQGQSVLSSTYGMVVYSGTLALGGNVVVVLGPKWRLHYYAHLKKSDVGALNLVGRGEKIGEVGTTGNAATTPPHLHYAILTLIPYPWRIDDSRQGWRKMFYLNPQDYFE